MTHYQHGHPEGAGRPIAYDRGGPNDGELSGGMGLGRIMHVAGALSSLALVVGVGVWGYQMATRDVSAVPVVRASEGPMRVQPADPGGTQTLHQGLSVNKVLAEGEAERPADRIILAPKPLDLTLEDQVAVVARQTDIDEVSPTRLAAIQALAEELSDGVAPMGQAPETEAEADPVPPTPEVAEAEQPEIKGGLKRSLRPKARPETVVASLDAAPALAAAAQSGFRDVDPDTIPVGTRLAQLGAFGSREIAEAEWTKLSDRFGDILGDKDRVIQRAQSGGRTFYRLRALGFDDLSDARRFCSVLVAERAECIPVVTR
jgi:hypothetical protein